MSGNNEKYFTAWYGVYHETTRTLCYASGGHHAAVLVSGAGEVALLRTDGPAIGFMPGLEYPSAQVTVPADSTMYVFSDGVYEIARPDGEWQTWDEFCRFLRGRPAVDAIVARAHALRGAEEFEDDFSLLKMSW